MGGLCLAAVTATANAQVEAYGVVDAGVAFLSDVGSGNSTRAVNSVSLPTVVGVRGVERFGTAWSVRFNLENGFGASSGSQNNPGALFDRQAFIGLSNSQFGSLTVGRHSRLNFDLVMPRHSAGATIGSTFAFHPGNLDELANMSATLRSLKYRTPVLNGWEAAVVVGQPGRSAGTASGRNMQVAIAYSTPTSAATISYGSDHDRYLRTLSQIGLSPFPGTEGGMEAVLAQRVTNFAIGWRHAQGTTIVTALVTRTRIELGGRVVSTQNADVAARWSPNTQLRYAASLSVSRIGDAQWATVGATATQLLSTRSAVYLQWLSQRAFRGGRAAIPFAGSVASDQTQQMLVAGIRHTF
ncbi:porin [Massilia sp. IC2-477]|uniref:porin n=1 Tax=Massilia sp. IC2-477 TaxID=2887198 RepID=UPI001D113CF7|nr:porin [Massilia sp. IC2-477]